jgi:hypothetical protein
MKTADAIRSAAMKLPREQVEALVSDLLIWLDDDEDLDEDQWLAAWMPELRRRIEDLESGRVKTVPAKQALEEIRERLKAGRA